MGKSSSDGSGETTVTTRYAEYLETLHESFLYTVASERSSAIDDSPFADYVALGFDDAFFGAAYTITSFPTLYDMFGKFMAGLDIDTLYSQIYEDTVNAPEIDDLVAAETAILDDEIQNTSLPRLMLSHRDTNSIMSSTYIVDQAILEANKLKAIDKFSAELRYRMIPVATERWKAHMTWNQQVVMDYAQIMKFYFSTKLDTTNLNYAIAAKDKLWPFTVLDYERAALGSLQGASTTTTDEGKESNSFLSTVTSVLSVAAMFI